MIVTVFPGQGSQTPGFLAPWLELDGVRERLDEYSAAAEVDLIAAGTQWDAERIRDTSVAQPLIVAASLVSYDALTDAAGTSPGGVAGHSVGEIAALVAAGVITASDGMRLVGLRGRAMAAAAALEATGMAAVLGGDRDTVLALLDELALTAANHNGAGQIVAAGALDALAELAAHPASGSRVIPLQVAGAFHTSYMAPAVETLRIAAADVAASTPEIALWTNRDGSLVEDGRTALDLLVDQVSSPVRWDLCMGAFADAGVTGIIEVTPAGTLVGLAKRALRGIPAVAVKTPDDLAAAAALLTGGDA
ncbi:ACP S-malonyltransferase [Microbacterium sp.]|uniref:ACP S-malonyltransferase n=1 Tax=Microbacterium sp. TaxID=51671 RepID=UPI003C77C5F8